MSTLLRRCIVVLALTGSTTAVAGSAVQAEPPITETRVVKDLTETFIDVVPTCDGRGALFNITTTANLVEHITESSTMVHVTFTQTGTFVAEAVDPAGQDASGRFTIWGGFNANPGGAVNGTFTFSLRGTLEDGTRVRFNSVDHFNVTPGGTEFFFTHCKP